MSELQIQKQMGVTRKSTRKYLGAAGLPSRGRGSKDSSNHFWNGGRTVDKSGYILLKDDDHPYRSAAGYVREHRVVMEQELGRYLSPGEVVDHINGVKGDNRLENLRVFPTNAAHLATTLKGRRPQWSEEGRAKLLAAHKARHTERTGYHPILDGDQ
ncbi:HNH endonuclease signature motif containing protein [Nakamurella sp. PAMC28650]|uniref:HNH endonuclease signature motif containing protein n=1 Tax=Nakamurella sp. PAMC28650 TaxID=2762325 RepID=UPI00164D2632|nr:HNH endonuclease [Nakamurella sp. PAMC28650]